MEVRIQSIHFDATEKLQQFIEKKVNKLERISDDLSTVEVILKVVKPETSDNKEAKITVLAAKSSLSSYKNFRSKIYVSDTTNQWTQLML